MTKEKRRRQSRNRTFQVTGENDRWRAEQFSIEEQIDRQEAVVLAMKKKIDDMKAKCEAEIEKMAKLVEKKKQMNARKFWNC